VRGPGECWPWLAGTTGGGYGYIVKGGKHGKMLGAHRVAYELTVGPIPPGLCIDHLCRNRACVNPAHLEPVTMQTNLLRGETAAAANAAKTACKRGHPFDEANTGRQDGGYRECRTCRRTRDREYKRSIARDRPATD
jgi:hypothetical protein